MIHLVDKGADLVVALGGRTEDDALGARGKVLADATPAELVKRHPSGKLDDVFRDITQPKAA